MNSAWSKEKPAEPGWYWWRVDSEYRPIPAQVITVSEPTRYGPTVVGPEQGLLAMLWGERHAPMSIAEFPGEWQRMQEAKP